MKKNKQVFLLLPGILVCVLFSACSLFGDIEDLRKMVTGEKTPSLPWAFAVNGSFSYFSGSAVDSSGNVYAAGYFSGKSGFGNSVIVPGNNYYKSVIVKYDNNGNEIWVRDVIGNRNSGFNSIAVDDSGNVYAAGYQFENNQFDYGGLKGKITGISSGYNAVLVKYDASGETQWAKTIIEGSFGCEFLSVAVTSSGIYAAGYQTGQGAYGYSTKARARVAGTSSGYNAVLVKYDVDGEAQWAISAKNMSSASDRSMFNSVAVHGHGNICVGGYQEGNSAFKYDTGSSPPTLDVKGAYADTNAVLVKFNSDGWAQWARTTVSASDNSSFHSVAVDASGNVYAAGQQNDTGTYSYGNTGNTVSATATTSGYMLENSVIVKFSQDGVAQWAKTVVKGSEMSGFHSISTDSLGNVYAAGYLQGAGVFDYGNGEINGAYTGGFNSVVVKYNNNGNAQGARVVTKAQARSLFIFVSVDNSGDIYTVGVQRGSGQFNYDNGSGPVYNVEGNMNDGAVIVKYPKDRF